MDQKRVNFECGSGYLNESMLSSCSDLTEQHNSPNCGSEQIAAKLEAGIHQHVQDVTKRAFQSMVKKVEQLIDFKLREFTESQQIKQLRYEKNVDVRLN